MRVFEGNSWTTDKRIAARFRKMHWSSFESLPQEACPNFRYSKKRGGGGLQFRKIILFRTNSVDVSHRNLWMNEKACRPLPPPLPSPLGNCIALNLAAPVGGVFGVCDALLDLLPGSGGNSGVLLLDLRSCGVAAPCSDTLDWGLASPVVSMAGDNSVPFIESWAPRY